MMSQFYPSNHPTDVLPRSGGSSLPSAFSQDQPTFPARAWEMQLMVLGWPQPQLPPQLSGSQGLAEVPSKSHILTFLLLLLSHETMQELTTGTRVWVRCLWPQWMDHRVELSTERLLRNPKHRSQRQPRWPYQLPKSCTNPSYKHWKARHIQFMYKFHCCCLSWSSYLLDYYK